MTGPRASPRPRRPSSRVCPAHLVLGSIYISTNRALQGIAECERGWRSIAIWPTLRRGRAEVSKPIAFFLVRILRSARLGEPDRARLAAEAGSHLIQTSPFAASATTCRVTSGLTYPGGSGLGS